MANWHGEESACTLTVEGAPVAKLCWVPPRWSDDGIGYWAYRIGAGEWVAITGIGRDQVRKARCYVESAVIEEDAAGG